MVFIEYNDESVNVAMKLFVLIESLVFVSSFVVLLVLYIIATNF